MVQTYARGVCDAIFLRLVLNTGFTRCPPATSTVARHSHAGALFPTTTRFICTAVFADSRAVPRPRPNTTPLRSRADIIKSRDPVR
ncbi:unnamed protein product [Pleuronectes platessa]|uniref:Uncharacterized protein n=1 Tax=Pleuronectes platessa TaxID=8262 RepID=A0A9N7ULL4_PLEPL|nr:unnamed protein product [Pleuronectes platessa]